MKPPMKRWMPTKSVVGFVKRKDMVMATVQAMCVCVYVCSGEQLWMHGWMQWKERRKLTVFRTVLRTNRSPTDFLI